MRAGKAAFLALLLASTFLLAGCWDVKDISDRSAIIAMGFDYLPQGRWRVTSQAALLAQGGSATYSGSVHFGEGRTLVEAISDLRTKLARRLYLGSAKVYVFGKGALQSRSTEVLRLLLQSAEIDQTAYVVGTEGTAESLLGQPDKAMGLTSIRLLKEFESEYESRDGHINEPLWQTVWGVLDPGDTLHIPIFNVVQSSVQASGTALVTEGRLRAILDSEESVTLRWLIDREGRNILTLNPPYDKYYLRTTKVVLTTRYNGKMRRIMVGISADLEAYSAPPMQIDYALNHQLAMAAAEKMVERITNITKKMQAANADGANWHQVAWEAGYPDFDLQRTTVSVEVRTRLAHWYAPSL